MERYFYLNSHNEQAGPVSPADFSRYGINETSMVWKQGMPNWMRAGQIPELSQYLHSTPPPPVGTNNNNGDNSGYSVNNSSHVNSNANNNQYKPMRPDNNMLWAILSTILCCVPTGVYAIIQASKVNDLYNNGSYAEAQEMANSAKTWSLVGAALGLVVCVVYFFLMLLAEL